MAMAAAIQEDGQSAQFDLDDMGSVDRDDAHGTARRMSRKEKRKLLKKKRRTLTRREAAKKEQEEIEARLNDPEERLKLEKMEQEEAKRMEMDRLEFEERERRFLEALEEKKRMEEQEEKKREEEQQRRQLEESQREQVKNENPNKAGEGSDWEYVEEGPPEIIWQGNEIIVRKKKIKVPKKKSEQQKSKEGIGRPISNPLAPECETFEDFKNAQEILESVAQKVPNFGTEQDKAHCPFHLKTGACRFGVHCSRVHFYPDKSCTLLMKNMYSGPGLSWEQDEGLEYTEEEIERSFEDFYEDVHTEFLKFGEIVNFKVCRNGSSHLRGNVYVHYKLLESAVLAYHSINGRYFAGKQITCEFVNVTKWKVAICGEFMKSRLKTCSRGSICNFIHCFRNPGGDYEWADLDKEPPRHWVRKMAALFGYKDGYHKYLDSGSSSQNRGDKMLSRDSESYRSIRSRSKDLVSRHMRSRRSDDWNIRRPRFRHGSYRKENSSDRDTDEESIRSKDECHRRRRNHKTYSNDDESDGILKDGHTNRRRRHRSRRRRGSIGVGSDSDEDSCYYESKIVNSRRNETLYRDKTHNQDYVFDSEASSFESYIDESRKGEERHTRSKRRGERGKDSEPEDSNNDSTDEKDPKYSRRLFKQPRQGLQFSNYEFRGGRSENDGEAEHSRHSSGSSRRKTKKSDSTRIHSPSRGEDSYMYESRKRGRDADGENKRSRANVKKRSSGHPRKYSLNDAFTQANDQEEKIKEDSYRDLVVGNCNEVSMRCLKENELNGSDERHEKGENEEGYEVQKLKAGSECLSIKQRSMDSGMEEMAYRRAALEKLEEKKRSKEKLLHENSDNILSLESGDIIAPGSMPMEANVVLENQKDEKVNINHRKRRRI